jgi:response regulator RpfG family c-di-GMP phosphodiesterase
MPHDLDSASNIPAPSPTDEGPLASRTVLVVDDEHGVRDLLCRWLESGGYCPTPAADAEQALGAMDSAPTAVALCDIGLPGHDGLWLADCIRHRYPDTAVIMATGLQDVGSAVESLRQGVVDYLTKPFGRDRLREAVWRGVEWHRAARDSRRWRETLEGETQARHVRLATAIAALRIDSDEALDAMLSMLTMSDRDAYAHAYRVAALSVSISRLLGLDEADVGTVERGAMLHDLGKLAMPEAVLRKPAPLTVEEQTLIRLHPRLGSELIERVPYLADAAAIVRDAHERVDGLGYPRGLRADDVWIGARIVTVADAYDTMTRPRVFRDAITPGEAFLELDRCSGTQFDPRVVEALKRVLAVH